MHLIKQLASARSCGVPLIAITTPDQLALVREITIAFNGKSNPDTPVVTWDRASGYLARNKKGEAALATMCQKENISPSDLKFQTAGANDAFRQAVSFPPKTIVLALSLNRFLHEESQGQTIQALLNLRDHFKADQRMVIALSPDFSFPPEIQHDFVLLDDPLPTDEGYAGLLSELVGPNGSDLKPKPNKDEVSQAVRSVRGLSAFEAEQVLAMSIASTDMTRLDLTESWALKVAAVEKVKGLSMTMSGPDIKDLRGLDQITSYLSRLWTGPEPPELVVRVDEIDKAMAGLGSNGGPGDNTGISQDLLKCFLTNMEGNGWTGAILVGVRGSGKTVLTESIGVANGVPTIAMDPGEMEGSLVGQSQQAFRDAFRTIKGIGGKRVLVLATCNKLEVLPPELMRRFKLGIWYFDLLTPEERASLWPVYLKKYGHKLNSALPNDDGWTGAEVRNCCEMAYRLGMSVKEYGETAIVPVTKSDPDSVSKMRQQATSRFLSASYPGTYHGAIASANEDKCRVFKKEGN